MNLRLPLKLHPDFVCDAIRAFEVDVARASANGLVLTYDIEGEVEDLSLPHARVGNRADELWRHTCFEAFVKPAGAEAYVELNLAPSGDFAAYRFDGYRAGMAPAYDIAPSAVETESRPSRGKKIGRGKRNGWYQRRVTWHVPGLSSTALGLSAVIIEAGGRTSYWALAHPPGAPDFHHPACFAARLPPPGQS